MLSLTYRELLARCYGAQAGRYSYGSLLDPGVLPKGSIVGNYGSFGPGISVFRRNHTMARVSQHPFFYNAACGVLEKDSIPTAEANPLTIESDVWIGANAIILPRCRRIGNGAVIGAGAVVTADVPDFAIVAGNPAKVIRKRFDDAICEVLLESRWWEHPLNDLVPVLPLFLENTDLKTAQRLRDHVVALRERAAQSPIETGRAIASVTDKA